MCQLTELQTGEDGPRLSVEGLVVTQRMANSGAISSFHKRMLHMARPAYDLLVSCASCILSFPSPLYVSTLSSTTVLTFAPASFCLRPVIPLLGLSVVQTLIYYSL